MIYLNSSSVLRNIYILSLASFFLVFGFSAAYAQEATGSAVSKYKITFPISTLGNCADLTSCKEYCEDSSNKEACENFAKSKGFYKVPEGKGNARSLLILGKAKEELGCTSDQDCKTLCKDEANKEKCDAFAKKYKLDGPKKTSSTAVLEKARTALGCISEESCKTVCKDEANREKCSYFAKQVGLPGGLIKIAPVNGKNQQGMEQIKKMMERCKDNPEYCQQNIATIEAELTKKSNEFCKTNPTKCKEMEKEVKKATGEAKLIKDKLKGPVARPTGDKIQFKDQVEIRDPKVQGVSTSPSIIARILQFFFN